MMIDMNLASLGNAQELAVRALDRLTSATATPELTPAYAAKLQPAADVAVLLVKAAKPMFSKGALRLPVAEASAGAAMLNRITRSTPAPDAWTLESMFKEAHRSFLYASSDVTTAHNLS